MHGGAADDRAVMEGSHWTEFGDDADRRWRAGNLQDATSSNHVAAKRPPTRSDSPPPQTHRRRHHHGGDGAASVAAAQSKGIWVFTPVYEQGNEAEGERDNLDGAYK